MKPVPNLVIRGYHAIAKSDSVRKKVILQTFAPVESALVLPTQ